jgi:cysteinyl-tRNA synthetase
MAVRLFNTLTRRVEDFVPLDPAGKTVGLYCCGPTVYDYAHIGNVRTFVFADLVRRWLEFRGFSVKHVMNITDVEDKIIRKVRETGTTLAQFTGQYEAEFFKDLETVGCLKPTETPRATEHIADIVELIARLIDKGVAYKAADGSVYFSIEKYRGCGCHYGQLVNLNFEEMRVGERVASDEYEKESVADFALWKARVPDDGDVFWESPWGQGRPGWHIECSAMAMKALGESFDLHLGGEDLMFPHHEDEIAQSEGATGKPFVKHWMHGMHLLVEGKKMSKSLGNFFTLRDLLAKGFSGREVRYLLLTAHYREQFNFTLEGLNGAKTALARLDDCLVRLGEVASGEDTAPMPGLIEHVSRALENDLNVSAAWGAVFDWIKDMNIRLAAGNLSGVEAKAALLAWMNVDKIFGVRPTKAPVSGKKEIRFQVLSVEEPPAELLALLEERQAARKAKDFKRSDAIRDELKAQGWVIEDTPKGPRLKKI